MKEINNYIIKSQIAEGGMGTVYYGEHKTLSRPVALKKLNSNLTGNPQFKDRFINEALILAQLNHPNIITIYDLLEENGDFYIVMEYVMGDTIDNVIQNMRSPFELKRGLNIFIQTLKAFNYAHGKGIVHRDIKPSNIILDENDVAKVLDFGIAKLIQSDLNLTKAGTKMGSLYYMSPEQVTGNPVDSRSDIFSLGVLLYELLTNSIPYNLKTDTEYEVMQAIVNQTPVKISDFRKDIPESISNVILRATEKNPDMRFSSCEEFESAINDAGYKYELSGQKAPIPSNNFSGNKTIIQSPSDFSPQMSMQTGGNQNKNMLILASVFIVILLGVIIVFVFTSNDSDDKVKVVEKPTIETENKTTNTEKNQNSTQSNNQTETKRNISTTPGDYPEGSEKYLDYSDIQNKSRYEIKIMKNEIFARHGYIFRINKDMVNHFNNQSWYEPKYYDVTNMLSDIEKANVNFLKKYE